jgi:hypothetical protein
MVWEFATVREAELTYDPGQRSAPLRLRSVRTYHGFELDSTEVAVDEFPPQHADAARRALAQAMAAGAAYHRGMRENREVFRELREVFRRSGGKTADVGEAALTDYFEKKLEGIESYSGFLERELHIDPDDFVSRPERKRWLALPDTIVLRGEEHPLDYAVEDSVGIVRARIPERLLWQLDESELPQMDRPLHWTVLRGKKGSVRAASLEEAKALMSLSKSQARARSRRGQPESSAESGAGPGRTSSGSSRARSPAGERPPRPRGSAGGSARGSSPRTGGRDEEDRSDGGRPPRGKSRRSPGRRPGRGRR